MAWSHSGMICLNLLIFLLPAINAAPLSELGADNLGYYPVSDKTGCYYNFQHYDEGDRIFTNEPCLNCTCHNKMLMCYLRVCPFIKAYGENCRVEKRADLCCPIITCPEVPVPLLSSNATQGSSDTALGRPDTYGCSIDGLFYADGVRIPGDPSKPCELCYCIRNKTACVMQECTLKIQGCLPVYHKDICCPIRYNCDRPEQIEGPSNSEQGLIFTTSTTTTTTTTTASTTTAASTSCIHNGEWYADGAQMPKEKPCESCYCMRGNMVCAVQECAPTPLEKINCTPLPPPEGECCPKFYECDHNIDEGLLTTELYQEKSTDIPGKVTSGDITTTLIDNTKPSQYDHPTTRESENSSETSNSKDGEEKEKTTRQFVPTEHSTAIREEESSTPKHFESSESEGSEQTTIEITEVSEGDSNRPVIPSESQVTTTEYQSSDENKKTTVIETQKTTQYVMESRSPETTEQYQTSTKQQDKFESVTSAVSHEQGEIIDSNSKPEEPFTSQSTEESSEPEKSFTSVGKEEDPVMETSTIQHELDSEEHSTAKTGSENGDVSTQFPNKIEENPSSTEYSENQRPTIQSDIDEIHSKPTLKPGEVLAVEEETPESAITEEAKKEDNAESLQTEDGLMTTTSHSESVHQTDEYEDDKPGYTSEQHDSFSEATPQTVSVSNDDQESTEPNQGGEKLSSTGTQATTGIKQKTEESTVKDHEISHDISATDALVPETTVPEGNTDESTEAIITEKTSSNEASQGTSSFESTESVISSEKTTEKDIYVEEVHSAQTDPLAHTPTQGEVTDEEEPEKSTTAKQPEDTADDNNNEISPEESISPGVPIAPETSSTDTTNPSNNIQESTDSGNVVTSEVSTDTSKSEEHSSIGSSTQKTVNTQESESVPPPNPSGITQEESKESTEPSKVTDDLAEISPEQTTLGKDEELSNEPSQTEEHFTASSSTESEKIDASSSEESIAEAQSTENSNKPLVQEAVETENHEGQTTEKDSGTSIEVEASQDSTKDYSTEESHISQKPAHSVDNSELTTTSKSAESTEPTIQHKPQSEPSTDKTKPFTSQEVHESEFTSVTLNSVQHSESDQSAQHTTPIASSTSRPFTSQEFDESLSPETSAIDKQWDSTESITSPDLTFNSSTSKPYTSHETSSPITSDIQSTTKESGHSPGTAADETQKSTESSTEFQSATENTSKSIPQKPTDSIQTEEGEKSQETQKSSPTPAEETTEYVQQHSQTTEERIVPGEGSCLVDGVTYENSASIEPINQCHISCKCVNSIVKCESISCDPPKADLQNCMAVYQGPDSCCPIYSCDTPGEQTMESDSQKKEKEKPPVTEGTGSSLGESTTSKQYNSEPTTKAPEKSIVTNFESEQEQPSSTEIVKPTEISSNGEQEISTKEYPPLEQNPAIHETTDDTSSKEPTYPTTVQQSTSSTEDDISSEIKTTESKPLKNNEKQETSSQIYETLPTKTHKLDETTLLPSDKGTSSESSTALENASEESTENLSSGESSTGSEISHTTKPILEENQEKVSNGHQTENENSVNLSTVDPKLETVTTENNSNEQSASEEQTKPTATEDNILHTETATNKQTTTLKHIDFTESVNEATENPINENVEPEESGTTSPSIEKEIETESFTKINEPKYEPTESSTDVLDENKQESTSQKLSDGDYSVVTVQQPSEGTTVSDSIYEKESVQPSSPPKNEQDNSPTLVLSNTNEKPTTESIAQSTHLTENEGKPISSSEHTTVSPPSGVQKPEEDKANNSVGETGKPEFVTEDTTSTGYVPTTTPELEGQTEKETHPLVDIKPESTEKVSSIDEHTIPHTEEVHSTSVSVDELSTKSSEESKTTSESPSIINSQTSPSENKDPHVAVTTAETPSKESDASVVYITTESHKYYDQEQSTQILEDEKTHKTKPESDSLETDAPIILPDNSNINNQGQVTVPNIPKQESTMIEFTSPTGQRESSTESLTFTEGSEQVSGSSFGESDIEVTEKISETETTEKKLINSLPEVSTEPNIKPEEEKVVTVFGNEEHISSTESVDVKQTIPPDTETTKKSDEELTTNASSEEKINPEEYFTKEMSSTSAKPELTESTEKILLDSGSEQTTPQYIEESEEKNDQTTFKTPNLIQPVEAVTTNTNVEDDHTSSESSPKGEVTENKDIEENIQTEATVSEQHTSTESSSSYHKETISPNLQDSSKETTKFVKQESTTVSDVSEADIITEKADESGGIPNTTEIKPEEEKVTEKVSEEQESTVKGTEEVQPTQKGPEDQSTERVPEVGQSTERQPEENIPTENELDESQSTGKINDENQTTEKGTEEEQLTEKHPSEAHSTEKTDNEITSTEKQPEVAETTEKVDELLTYKPVIQDVEPIISDDTEKATSDVENELTVTEEVSTEKEPLQHVTPNAPEMQPTKSVEHELQSTDHPKHSVEDEMVTNKISTIQPETTNEKITPEYNENEIEPESTDKNPLQHVTPTVPEILPTKSVEDELHSTDHPKHTVEDELATNKISPLQPEATNENITPEYVEKETTPGLQISENAQTDKPLDSTKQSISLDETETTEKAIYHEKETTPGLQISDNAQTDKPLDPNEESTSLDETETTEKVINKEPSSSEEYKTSSNSPTTLNISENQEATTHGQFEKSTSEDDRYSAPTTQSSSESNLRDKDKEGATIGPITDETSTSGVSGEQVNVTTGPQSTKDESASTILPSSKYPDVDNVKDETLAANDLGDLHQGPSSTLTTSTEKMIILEDNHSTVIDEKEDTDVTTKSSVKDEHGGVTDLVTEPVHEKETTTKQQVSQTVGGESIISSDTSVVTPQTPSHPEKLPSLPDYQEPDYEENGDEFGPGTCRYGGKVYVSAQQIPRDDPCDFCFCFRSDIICLQQSCPPPIRNCHQEPIRGFCCPRYECPVSMAVSMNVTTTTTTTTTTLPPHFLSHAYKGKAVKAGCLIKGQAYQVGDPISSASGPCLQCKCGGHGQMECNPVVCSPNPMLEQMLTVAATSKKRR